MAGSDFDWMVSNHAVWGWKAPVKTSVSGVSLLQLSLFFASIFLQETPDTQARGCKSYFTDYNRKIHQIFSKIIFKKNMIARLQN